MYARLPAIAVAIILDLQIAGCGRGEVSFSADVMPVLEVACIECHTSAGEGVAASGFAVNNYESVMKGTDLGPAVVAVVHRTRGALGVAGGAALLLKAMGMACWPW